MDTIRTDVDVGIRADSVVAIVCYEIAAAATLLMMLVLPGL